VLSNTSERPRNATASSTTLALTYGFLGDKNRAFAALEYAERDREGGFIVMRVDPQWEPLWSDPRFEELARRVGVAR